jgi:hypothetical protein
MNLKKENIVLLEIEHLMDINDMILQKSREQKEIVYSGEETYSIEHKKYKH